MMHITIIMTITGTRITTRTNRPGSCCGRFTFWRSARYSPASCSMLSSSARAVSEFWGASLFVAQGHDSVGGSHGVPFWVGALPLVMGITGIFAAWIAYRIKPGIPAMVTGNMRTVYNLVFHKYYFDEIYKFLFVRPAGWLGQVFWRGGDGFVIDGFGPNGLALITRRLAGKVSQSETGYLYHYAFVMLIGVVGLVTWYLYRAA